MQTIIVSWSARSFFFVCTLLNLGAPVRCPRTLSLERNESVYLTSDIQVPQNCNLYHHVSVCQKCMHLSSSILFGRTIMQNFTRCYYANLLPLISMLTGILRPNPRQTFTPLTALFTPLIYAFSRTHMVICTMTRFSVVSSPF